MTTKKPRRLRLRREVPKHENIDQELARMAASARVPRPGMTFSAARDAVEHRLEEMGRAPETISLDSGAAPNSEVMRTRTVTRDRDAVVTRYQFAVERDMARRQIVIGCTVTRTQPNGQEARFNMTYGIDDMRLDRPSGDVTDYLAHVLIDYTQRCLPVVDYITFAPALAQFIGSPDSDGVWGSAHRLRGSRPAILAALDDRFLEPDIRSAVNQLRG